MDVLWHETICCTDGRVLLRSMRHWDENLEARDLPCTSRGGGLRARHVQRLRSTSACETTVLARLSRPDLAFMVGRLASNVSRWSQWDDRQLLPVISYLNTTRICHCWNSITWLWTSDLRLHTRWICKLSVDLQVHKWHLHSHRHRQISASNILAKQEAVKYCEINIGVWNDSHVFWSLRRGAPDRGHADLLTC